MARYDYRCDECGEMLDIEERTSEHDTGFVPRVSLIRQLGHPPAVWRVLPGYKRQDLKENVQLKLECLRSTESEKLHREPR